MNLTQLMSALTHRTRLAVRGNRLVRMRGDRVVAVFAAEGWRESDHPRAESEAKGYKPGQFVPKDEGQGAAEGGEKSDDQAIVGHGEADARKRKPLIFDRDIRQRLKDLKLPTTDEAIAAFKRGQERQREGKAGKGKEKPAEKKPLEPKKGDKPVPAVGIGETPNVAKAQHEVFSQWKQQAKDATDDQLRALLADIEKNPKNHPGALTAKRIAGDELKLRAESAKRAAKPPVPAAQPQPAKPAAPKPTDKPTESAKAPESQSKPESPKQPQSSPPPPAQEVKSPPPAPPSTAAKDLPSFPAPENQGPGREVDTGSKAEKIPPAPSESAEKPQATKPLTAKEVAAQWLEKSRSESSGDWNDQSRRQYADNLERMARKIEKAGWIRTENLGIDEVSRGRRDALKRAGLLDVMWDEQGNPHYALKGTPKRPGLLDDAEMTEKEKAASDQPQEPQSAVHPDTGIFGQPEYRAQGNTQQPMFHEPVKVERPSNLEGESKKLQDFAKKEGTGEMFPAATSAMKGPDTDDAIKEAKRQEQYQLPRKGQSAEVAKRFAQANTTDVEDAAAETGGYARVSIPVDKLSVDESHIDDERQGRLESLGGSKDPVFITDYGITNKGKPVIRVSNGNNRVKYAKDHGQQTVDAYVNLKVLEENKSEPWAAEALKKINGGNPDKPQAQAEPSKPAPQKRFTKSAIESKLLRNLDSTDAGYTPEDERVVQEAAGAGDPFTFHKHLPTEVKEFMEGRPELRRLFRVTDTAAEAGGADAFGDLGDRYLDIAERKAGSPLRKAVAEARKSPDPEIQFLAAIYDNMPPHKERPAQEVVKADALKSGETFKINGHDFRVEMDDSGYRVLRDGVDYPEVPVDALDEIPVDKGSEKAQTTPDKDSDLTTIMPARERPAGEAIPEKPEQTEHYINGDRVRYTGTIGKDGAHEIEYLEGSKAGKKGVTYRPPTGPDPFADRAKKEWEEQQEQFRRLKEEKSKTAQEPAGKSAEPQALEPVTSTGPQDIDESSAIETEAGAQLRQRIDSLRRAAEQSDKRAEQEYERSEYPNVGRAAYKAIAEAQRNLADVLSQSAPEGSDNQREQRQIDRAEALKRKAAYARLKAAEYQAASHDVTSRIPFGQPILVGHHSEGGHRRALERSDNAMRKAIEWSNQAKEYDRQAKAAMANTSIYADDPEAVQKLKQQAESLSKWQNRMKEINDLYKKHGNVDRIPGLTDQERKTAASHLRFAGRPFPAYAMTNNAANLRRIKQRIEQVGQLQARPAQSRMIGEDIRVQDDTDRQRVEIHFPGKPSPDVISFMKLRGFRWTPSIRAWTRTRGNAADSAIAELATKLGKTVAIK